MDSEMDFYERIQQEFGGSRVDPVSYSPLTLAYIGDAVYELIIRSVTVGEGNRPPVKLHRESSGFAIARTQKTIVTALMDELTPQEQSVYRRGRNAQPGTVARHATVSDYHKATGLEALLGWLYITGQTDRMLFLVRRGYEIIKNGEGKEHGSENKSENGSENKSENESESKSGNESD